MNNNLESVIPLLNKKLKIIQRSDYFNFSIDSLLVSEFVSIKKDTKNIIDLGTGNAVIPLFLSKKTSAKIFGMEIQKISFELAQRNININNLNEQIYIIYDDMKNYKKYFLNGSFDIVVSNPPFFKFNGNKELLNDLEQLSIARHEIEITLEELIQTASLLVKDRGYFYLVHRADRLTEIISALQKFNFEAKKIKFCYTTENKNAKIVLIEAIKSGKAGLTILPPLVINKNNGEYTEEVLEMFK
ncbi:tRNA1(Val) (adenine(37)-N6)-methyltransferase [Fusobacterium massiliense]|jgi:ribosomal protein L11 methyltransferase (prmA)|uniref:tRNA1(Val) (adenine(37)-N6)-methyltransferase n=1 Tax=Fusobacterium massiliense TaxID=1852365 RepID=UPI00093C2CB9|nr:tRNA1(Val) (adenine(37)-N6)-methyltransferase [Fusobacterium massiliense]